MDEKNREIQTRLMLEEVSPTYCAAKWSQVTLHLEKGLTHSCHHPNPHQIPLNEVTMDPSALHNTAYKKKVREEMLRGEQVEECSYCWNIEKLGDEEVSDRVLKSQASWSSPFLRPSSSELEDPIPRYVEVSFSNKCNLRCSYCSPLFSSAIEQEYERFGEYQAIAKNNHMISKEHSSIYQKSFWRWLIEIHSKLLVLRVTGGEPLLNPQLFELFDFLSKYASPQLSLEINSNLSLPMNLIESGFNKMKELQATKKIKQVSFFTSLDSYGEQAEYIRFGMSYQKVVAGIKECLSQFPNGEVTVMVTLNILSLPGFSLLLNDIRQIKSWSQKNNLGRLNIDVSYLRHPEFMSVGLVTSPYKLKILEALNFMEQNEEFGEIEKTKIKRIYSWAESNRENHDNFRLKRKLFHQFFQEYDKRKKTNIAKIFPELSSFFEICEVAASF